MSVFVSWAMRSAAGILLTLAIVTIVAGLITVLVPLFGFDGPDSMSPYAPGGVRGSLWLALLPLAGAFQGAVWPFLGAAALWRWDQHIRSRGMAE